MSNNLYITATESRSGKSAISLGVTELLLRNIRNVGFFRPFINPNGAGARLDNDIHLIGSHFNLGLDDEDMYAFTASEASKMLADGRKEAVLEGILSKYQALEKKCDFILCEGTDYMRSTSSFEFDLNAEIANNLGCPVLLVANAYKKSVGDLFRALELSMDSFEEKGCRVVGTFINRIDPKNKKQILERWADQGKFQDKIVYTLPNLPLLGKPTMAEIVEATGAEVLYGKDELMRHVQGFSVATMQLSHFLPDLKSGQLIIVSGDRADVIISCLAKAHTRSASNIAGILLTNGLRPESSVAELIEEFPCRVPIVSVETDAFACARLVDRVHAVITPDNQRKINQALGIFDRNVDTRQLSDIIVTTQAAIITPKMFEYRNLQQARQHRQHIVLPEGEDERILKAAETLVRRDVVNLTLLGNPDRIRQKASQIGIGLDGIGIVFPEASEMLDGFAETYYDLRRHKGLIPEAAWETMLDVSYFGTMMIYKGFADGMVSGAVHTTGATIRPSFEFVKTKPGFSVVSSVFLMCLEDRVLVYGDCAINPNPDSRQLAEIAIASAQTASMFGIEPRVAMLSYSTGDSGKGEDVERVREATRIAREMAVNSYPGLLLEGPIQYDAAVDLDVAKTKMPDSEVAGRATVFIFPDLNTGNNTYKAVQRSAKAVAIGPILQGLNRPVNDLSRGCTVADIVNTVVITAIQAQAEKGLIQ